MLEVSGRQGAEREANEAGVGCPNLTPLASQHIAKSPGQDGCFVIEQSLVELVSG